MTSAQKASNATRMGNITRAIKKLELSIDRIFDGGYEISPYQRNRADQLKAERDGLQNEWQQLYDANRQMV